MVADTAAGGKHLQNCILRSAFEKVEEVEHCSPKIGFGNHSNSTPAAGPWCIVAVAYLGD